MAPCSEKMYTVCLFCCVKAVHREMEEALREKDELKMRVHSYISEVAKIEKMMTAKVKHIYMLFSFAAL